MKTAIYPGSFDPITMGHIDIIRRLAPLFNPLIVVVANSRNKNYLFQLNEREELIRPNLKDLSTVRVESCEGLITDHARKVGASVMIRGLRAISDFEVETAMANMNKKLAPEIETMIVFTRPEYSYVASRMVKEVASHRGNLEGLVPSNVAQALELKFAKDKS
jgi:pantetheine-phosphate adenylyltransferase